MALLNNLWINKFGEFIVVKLFKTPYVSINQYVICENSTFTDILMRAKKD